jgi:hypothetical protein
LTVHDLLYLVASLAFVTAAEASHCQFPMINLHHPVSPREYLKNDRYAFVSQTLFYLADTDPQALHTRNSEERWT